jgi:hypothetical protein
MTVADLVVEAKRQINMEIKNHVYRGTPISIDVSPVDNGKGYWNSNKVVVRYDGKEIGEYIRSYPSFVIATFHPFKLGDEWYALYAADYTATRVAKLTPTKFIDWCGEDESATGFCPTEFWVPMGMKYDWLYTGNGEEKILHMDTWFDGEFDDEDEFFKDYADVEADNKNQNIALSWANYGFLSGCYWGDDGSWKLRHIDLTGIPDKKLIITEKFGYWELPDRIRKCIRVFEHGHIQLTGEFTMNMNKPIPNDLFKPEFFVEVPND